MVLTPLAVLEKGLEKGPVGARMAVPGEADGCYGPFSSRSLYREQVAAAESVPSGQPFVLFSPGLAFELDECRWNGYGRS